MSEEAVGYVGLGAMVGLIGLRLLLAGRRDRPGCAGDLAPPFGDDAGTLPLNTVRMQRTDFLRVRTRYDVGLHLSAQNEGYGGTARPAGEPKRRRDSVEFAGYDSDELRRPRWSPRGPCAAFRGGRWPATPSRSPSSPAVRATCAGPAPRRSSGGKASSASPARRAESA